MFLMFSGIVKGAAKRTYANFRFNPFASLVERAGVRGGRFG